MADDVLYQRHEGLDIERDQTVIVVGCGGIGSWLGYFLALAGVRTLHLFDGDKIEEHNLSRLPFTPKDIGRFKSEALADLISRSRPGVEVQAHAHFDAEFDDSVLRQADWVVVSTDSHKSRVMVHKAVQAVNAKVDYFRHAFALHTTKYLECGADGHSGSVTGAPAEWVTAAEDNPGYASVPVFVAPCTWAASVAAYFVLLSSSIQSTYRIDWSRGNVRITQFDEGEVASGTQIEGEEVEGAFREVLDDHTHR